MADGVAAKDVYKTLSTEVGMTRELNQILQIKPYVAMWWSSGAQPVQALASGEVVMALGWNGRFQSGIDQGQPIAMSWGQSVAQVGYFMIVKGAPNKTAAMKLLNYIMKPEVQARFSHYVAYEPVTPASIALIVHARTVGECAFSRYWLVSGSFSGRRGSLPRDDAGIVRDAAASPAFAVRSLLNEGVGND